MLHLIAKPLKGKKARLFEEIRQRLDEAGAEYEFHITKHKGETGELAAELTKEGETTLVVVGGDGTLNDVLSGITDPAHCTLGLIPAGTGNDFADSAKIPNGIAALDLILNSEPKETDYIKFSDGRRSMNIAGLGIDVDILIRCEKKRGRGKYFRSLIASLFKYHGCRMKVSADGKLLAEGNMLLAAVCNGRQFGGGIPICPPAKIDDSKLGLVYVDCPSRLKIPLALVKLMKGKVLSLPFTHFVECGEAEFVSEPPFMAQYDGELYETQTFRAEIGRGLKMFRG